MIVTVFIITKDSWVHYHHLHEMVEAQFSAVVLRLWDTTHKYNRRTYFSSRWGSSKRFNLYDTVSKRYAQSSLVQVLTMLHLSDITSKFRIVATFVMEDIWT